MQAFHIPGAAPLYTNTFLLISDAGHAVVIDPAAETALTLPAHNALPQCGALARSFLLEM